MTDPVPHPKHPADSEKPSGSNAAPKEGTGREPFRPPNPVMSPRPGPPSNRSPRARKELGLPPAYRRLLLRFHQMVVTCHMFDPGVVIIPSYFLEPTFF